MTPLPETPVAIERTADGALALYALTADGIAPLGVHATPAAAWRAIDAIDLGEALPAPTLARAA